MDVEEGKLEEELVDKPGTTIRNEVFRIALYSNPVYNDMWFLTVTHSYEYPCSSQSFPSDNTAGVLSRTFIVKKLSNSLTCTVASSWRLHFSIGCYNRRRTSRCRHGFQFSGTQILHADHVHRRSGVYNKFSFLWFKG